MQSRRPRGRRGSGAGLLAAAVLVLGACTGCEGQEVAGASAAGGRPPELTLADLPPGWAEVAAGGTADGAPTCLRPVDALLPPADSVTERAFSGGGLGRRLGQRVLRFRDAATATTALEQVLATVVPTCEGRDVATTTGVVHLHVGVVPAPPAGDSSFGLHVTTDDLSGFRTASDTLVALRGSSLVVLDLGGPFTDVRDLDLGLLSDLLRVSVERVPGP